MCLFQVLHGLRKVASTNLAEAGASELMLMPIMEWTNPSQAKVYTEKTRSKDMAKKPWICPMMRNKNRLRIS